MSLENELKTTRCALEEATAANKAMAAQLVTAMDRLSEQLAGAPASAAPPVAEEKPKKTPAKKKTAAKKKVAAKKAPAEEITAASVKEKLTLVLQKGSINVVTAKLSEVMGSGVNYQELEPNDERLVALNKFAEEQLAG
jgi:hypothetical protein